MPKKPWATKEWVAMRDIKLYKFMMDKFSNVFWEKVWVAGIHSSRDLLNSKPFTM
jgi:hypothetical protein